MADVVSAALHGAGNASSTAPVLAFAAGAASSFGPCIGPRLLTLAALCSQRQGAARWMAAGIFTAGLCAGYAIIGTVADAAGLASALSPAIYRTLAAAAVAGAAWTIVHRRQSDCCRREHRINGGLGFFAGLASVCVTSPCCGPVGAALAGVAAAAAGPRYAAAIVLAFALGHVLPLAAIAAGSVRVRGAVARAAVSGAGATISGALMLATGAYYAVLA
jgi:cytochrome c biogenesis protein CcdA